MQEREISNLSLCRTDGRHVFRNEHPGTSGPPCPNMHAYKSVKTSPERTAHRLLGIPGGKRGVAAGSADRTLGDDHRPCVRVGIGIGRNGQDDASKQQQRHDRKARARHPGGLGPEMIEKEDDVTKVDLSKNLEPHIYPVLLNLIPSSGSLAHVGHVTQVYGFLWVRVDPTVEQRSSGQSLYFYV